MRRVFASDRASPPRQSGWGGTFATRVEKLRIRGRAAIRSGLIFSETNLARVFALYGTEGTKVASKEDQKNIVNAAYLILLA